MAREEEGAEVGYAVNVALLKQIDDPFDNHTARLTACRGQREADSACCLRHALLPYLFGEQFQQFGDIDVEGLRQALQHLRRWIFLPALDLPHIDFREARFISQLFDGHMPVLPLPPYDTPDDLLQVCHSVLLNISASTYALSIATEQDMLLA